MLSKNLIGFLIKSFKRWGDLHLEWTFLIDHRLPSLNLQNVIVENIRSIHLASLDVFIGRIDGDVGWLADSPASLYLTFK
jgi:hypothetical protein